MSVTSWHKIHLPETAHNVHLAGGNVNHDCGGKLRLHYSSLVTPNSTLIYDKGDGGCGGGSAPPSSSSLTALKEAEVPEYDRTKYGCERTTVSVSDGATVPVSVVYRRDLYPHGLKVRLSIYLFISVSISISPFLPLPLPPSLFALRL